MKLAGSQVRESINLKVTLWAGVWAVLGDDQAVCAQRLASVAAEDVRLHQDLVVAAGVDGLVVEVLVEVVEHVLVTKTSGGATGALVPPVVVVVGDMEGAEVYIAQDVRVADKRGFPMVAANMLVFYPNLNA